ncbi:hypothetical protein E2C01_008993 [Portunus trituberculatus]|uniref:Uncharacterized protein n=1 Tax=Portunus trituberculatus TaxID=210409 RepID=A0A5B7D536_PORTR|nr:hypothetical protein [Portunus trituberculatus]
MRANTATNVTQLNQGLVCGLERESGRAAGCPRNTVLLGRKWAFYPVSLATTLHLGTRGSPSPHCKLF